MTAKEGLRYFLPKKIKISVLEKGQNKLVNSGFVTIDTFILQKGSISEQDDTAVVVTGTNGLF